MGSLRFVQHRGQPEWGPGVIVADKGAGKVDVLFLDGGRRLLSRAHSMLEPLPDEAVPLESPLRDQLRWTEVENRREAVATFEAMLERFLRRFPEAFRDGRYTEQERPYKDQAVAASRVLLAQEELLALVAQGDVGHAEIFKRAIESANKANLIFSHEKIKLRAMPRESHAGFASTLVDALYGDGEYAVRVERFADLLGRYDAAKWTVATYFGFVVDPQRNPFVKPSAVKATATALHRDIQYRPEPNANTLRRVVALYDDVAAKLRAAGLTPADYIDVQGFLWFGTGANEQVAA